jgi:ABC-type glycerol-3-phosphate transport system substrate-binding protein
MNTFRPFQIGLIGIFGILAVIAIVVLTTYQAQKANKEQAYGESVVIWGTLSQDVFKSQIQDIARIDKAFHVVEYRQFDEASFDYELINAIAEGRSPDLVVLSANALTTHRSKLIPISYEALSQRYFKDTFIDGAEIFAFTEGSYGVPFAVDPLLLYWNRDLFASNGLAQAPRSWEAIVADVVPHTTLRDTTRNILKSALAFGEVRNVKEAKAVLMLLALQTGSKMVVAEEDRYIVSLNETQTGGGLPFENAVQFFTDFSNTQSTRYTWNRAMPMDTNAFLAGDLALYFGLGSEYKEIVDKNPNLNFDIAPVPQGANATALRTYGEFYAFAIPKASDNKQGAFAVANLLTRKDNVDTLTRGLNFAPVRRDLISESDNDLYRRVVLESALIARGWLDPGKEESDAIFMQMIEDVVSNRARVNDAVGDAIDRLILAY